MDNKGSPAVLARKTKLTPKAIIHKRFGTNACYTVEEVQESAQNECPGLAIPQKGPSLFRCRLQLPEFSVVSETFKKKKDAEQSAAEMALKKLGNPPAADDQTEQDPWDALVERIAFIFSDEFLSSRHPLSGHIKAALRREGDLNGLVPASVIAVCDAKLSNICKLLNPKVESNIFLALSFIMKATARLSKSVVTAKGQLSIRKQNPYPSEIIESSDIQESVSQESIKVKAILIPDALNKTIEPVTLNVSSAGYYLDVIAQKLGVIDANMVLLSRTIGKGSSETRLYFAASASFVLDLSSDPESIKEFNLEGSLNARASYLCGQGIYGDAIMASMGYTWRSRELFHEDVSLQSYYRMLISKIPSGNYKLSREAILAAELPSVFNAKTNWRGSLPKEILCTFCRQHQLSEPVFSTISIPLKASHEMSSSQKKFKATEATDLGTEYANDGATADGTGESVGLDSSFRCEIKIFSKFQDLIIECFPKEIYKKQSDSVHNASLKVLSWLNAYFKDLNMPLEKLKQSADVLDIQFYPKSFFKEFVFCPSIHGVPQSQGPKLECKSTNVLENLSHQGVFSPSIEGSDSGLCPSIGSLLCISYSVSLVTEGNDKKELLERNDEFEFEIGTGAVISSLEAVVTQMSVGQSAYFNVDLPPQEFILAAADNFSGVFSLLTSQACCLHYSICLLHVTEPPEERMEQAFFNPPLAKQRVEYAVHHIKRSSATTLVDFGCGSGSLLDSLLDYPTSLEKIVGVDISQKSLSRAAKILHSKLSTKSDTGIQTAVLYDGSITVFDYRLCGFDIGTCLEVIEHMEEDQACLFGDVVLSYFRPKILIVSTPNYEFNVILQKSSLTSEEDPDDKTQSVPCKFRNHDHKFEWTREQFNHWASELAKKHNYSVEFSGVGGSADVEPGFASQIAVFKQEIQLEEDDGGSADVEPGFASQIAVFKQEIQLEEDDGGSADVEPGFTSGIADFKQELQLEEDDLQKNETSTEHCKVIWEWNSSARSDSSF